MVADDRPPILVLGLGNLLLQDDAIGLELLDALRDEPCKDVEWIDSRTRGIDLLSALSGRRAALILDAVELGDAPGTVHVLDEPPTSRPPRGDRGGEASAGGLLATAQRTGDLPEHVVIVGVEPETVRTGIGLSPAVRAAIPAAKQAALVALDALRRTTCTG